MTLRKKCIATSARAVLVAFGIAAAAHAAPPSGTVALTSGLLFAQGADGHAKILATGSAIGEGDRLVSGKMVFARVDFADKSSVILGPDTEVAVGQGQFTLIHGAIQVSGGASVLTELGTISGADSRFVVKYSPVEAGKVAMGTRILLAELSPELSGLHSDASPLQVAQNTAPAPGGQLQPGLYVQVLDGLIHVTNPAGTANFSAGQFGFTPSLRTPPVILPSNPGLQFTLPAAFNTSTGTGSSPASNSKAGAVDCEVR